MSILAKHIADPSIIKLSDHFPRVIFWDCDLDKLDLIDDADFIIPRVLDRGAMLNCLGELKKLYKLSVIKHYCLNSYEIFGNENIVEVAKEFELSPEQFPGYNKDIQLQF